MRATLLSTGPGAVPGLLTRDAWRAVDDADRVLSDRPAVVDALARQGVAAELVEDLDSALRGAAADDDRHVVVLTSGEVRLPADVQGTSIEAAYGAPGSAFLELVEVMDRLRTECPWDREQTHRTLAKYLLEETYETLEAIESGDREHLREELGDLLLQVCFHARIAAEDPIGGFDVDDVARGIADKLVYRHPHVFAGLEVADADEVDRNWETLKAAEKKRASLLDGIPEALPALAWADKVLGRLTKAGAVDGVPTEQESLGGRLLALVAEARRSGSDPEQELREAVRSLIEGASLD